MTTEEKSSAFWLIAIVLFALVSIFLLSYGEVKKTENNTIVFPKFYNESFITQPPVGSHKFFVGLQKYKDSLVNEKYKRDTLVFLDSIKKLILNKKLVMNEY